MNTGSHDSFSGKVYEVVGAIPKGEVLTYKQVAELAGSPRAFRAVGNILNKNRNPRVPCHRVIRSDGRIGGFAWGADAKAELLKKEGAIRLPVRPAIRPVFRPPIRHQVLGQHQMSTSSVETSAPVLTPAFFQRPALEVAQDLLGKYLVRSIGAPGLESRKNIALMITEVEAYDGPHDLACHASKGRTARTEPMFAEGGRFYVYLCYGMHWMLNIVTGPADYPAAVLIRGVAGSADVASDESELASDTTSPRHLNGPAKLTTYLQINKSLNEKPANPASGLWFEDLGTRKHLGARVPQRKIKSSPRVGVDYAGPEWSKKPWRFTLIP